MIALALGNPMISAVLGPSYLTDEDFERGKALTPEERGLNSTNFRDHVLYHPRTRANV